MEASWLWSWEDNDDWAFGPSSNEPNTLEQAMLETFRARGHNHLVSAFMKRRKYFRVMLSFNLHGTTQVSASWLRREAFLGEEAGCPFALPIQPDDEKAARIAYYNLLKAKYGADEGYRDFMTRNIVLKQVAMLKDKGEVWSEDEDEENHAGVVVGGGGEMKSTESEPGGEKKGEQSKGSATASSGTTPALSPDATSTEQTTATTTVDQPVILTAKHPDSEIEQSLGALAIKV